ncbi:elongation factor G 1 [Geobacter sp. SVR]|nr:elongation factor G 1 [Geobacter sp. SVR]
MWLAGRQKICPSMNTLRSAPCPLRRRTAIQELDTIRNIGIISHIDAGKTTVTERILFYTGETHKMGEVHDGLAVMDWMPQEQERGITITATATSCRWHEFRLNLIDTPGHIDFTVEVERTLRVLDGAVAIFSAVEGVQPQSESVWRQADRYGVPRICFINKMDRVGADYRNTLRQIEHLLKARPVLVQLPLCEKENPHGVIDLISGESCRFDERDLGRTVRRGDVPPEQAGEVRTARLALTEAAADFDDTILADYLDGRPVEGDRLREALRRGTLACRLFPVLLGSALRNSGVQPLLDAVCWYLPSPLDARPLTGKNPGTGERETVVCDPHAPLRALAFKVMSDEGRMLIYLRIYSGTVHEGGTLFNASRLCTEKIGRLFRMHAHRREEISRAFAGDIVTVLGFRATATGDTLCDPTRPVLLEGLTVPEPVVSIAVEPKGGSDRERLPAALEKLQWEDPTFRVHEDEGTGQLILTGMGELHLEVIVDRLGREYGLQVKTGRPRVVYRETLRRSVTWRESFRIDGEGRGDTGEVQLRLTPLPPGSGVSLMLPPQAEGMPAGLCASVEESLRLACLAGCRTGYPLTDLMVEVLEIPWQPGLSSEAGVRGAAQRGLLLAARSAEPYLLEPLMALDLTVPSECLGRVIGTLQQKNGRVEGVASQGGSEVLKATVPLAGMFGYMTELRGATRGRGSYTMELSRFVEAPADVQQRFGLL